jgi:phage terminase Nu1 subunit (DNA packaging protein)
MSKAHEMTASAFASAVGADRHQIAKKLTELKARSQGKRNGGDLFALRDLVAAHLGGYEREARIRKLTCEAERIEIQNARSQGELVEVEKVKRLGESIMAAIRSRILNMPMTNEQKDSIFRELLSLKDTDWTR